MCNGKFDYVINLKESGMVSKEGRLPDLTGAVCVEHSTGVSGMIRIKLKLKSGEDVLLLINSWA